MRIALMTGGGDAPGLNGIIEASCKALIKAGHEIIGIEDGFEGVFSEQHKIITLNDVEGIHENAGTLLGTSNRCGTKGREAEFLEKFKKLKCQGMIVAGGDGTFAGMKPFEKEIPIIGVPKTIDNDLSGTDVTFGFDTACSVVTSAIASLKSTANAHRRIILVETMGRTAGWIALGGGLAGYAGVILIPERPYDKVELLQFIKKKQSEGKRGLIISISEGATAVGEDVTVHHMVEGSPEAKRLGGVSEKLARWLEKELNWEARNVILGHLQRASHPTNQDRFLTLSMGVMVARLVLEDKWGQAVVMREGKLTHAPIGDLMGPARLVNWDHPWVRLARSLDIFV